MKSRREQAPGHFDDRYRQDLLEGQVRRRRESERAVGFLTSPRSREELAEKFGEAFVRSATSGHAETPLALDSAGTEDVGGPFVETGEQQEYARGADASNPPDAEPAAFPLGRDPLGREVESVSMGGGGSRDSTAQRIRAFIEIEPDALEGHDDWRER